jgi:hypothetical protein
MHASIRLIQAGKILVDPAHWCQGALARDKVGKEVLPKSRAAVKWDANGIIFNVCRVNPNEFDEKRLDYAAECIAALDLCAQSRYRRGITPVNDTMEHADVIDVFRDAVRRTAGRERAEQEFGKRR